MRRLFLAFMVAAFVASCATYGTRTEGVSGPLAWHLTDLKLTQERTHGVYAFTLVLKENQGKTLTFRHSHNRIISGDIGQLSESDQDISLRLQLHSIQHFPLTYTFQCFGGDCTAHEFYNIAPRWILTLTGEEADGTPVKAVIQMKLPANPDTYQRR